MSAEFTVEREAFLVALERILSVVDHNAAVPILRHILIDAQGDTLTLVASNLETEITTHCQAEIATPGALALPGRKLHDILKNQAALTPLRVRVGADRANLTANKGRFSVGFLPAEDYPRMERTTTPEATWSLPQRDLKQLLGKVAFAMANGDVRYYLNGLHLALAHDTLTATASDGHRLARAWLTLPVPSAAPAEGILNRQAVLSLARLLRPNDDPVTLALSERQITARLGPITMISKLIGGRFPDADRVIPRNLPNRAILDRAALLAAAQRCAVLSNETYRGVRLTFADGNLKLEAQNTEGESALEDFEIDYRGPETVIGFNVAYLREVLDAIDTDQVEAELSDGNNSSRWHGAGAESETFVLMPMRL